MKKNIVVTMTAVMSAALLITACGSKKADNSEASSAAESTEAVTESAEDDAENKAAESGSYNDDAAEGDVVEKTVKTSDNGLEVKVTTINSEESTATDGNKTLNFYGCFETISVVTEGYDALNESLKASSDAIKEAYDADYADNKSFLNDALDTAYDDENNWSMSNFVSPVRCDDIVFSYFRTDDSFLGGAHPNSYITGYNFDSKTGAELKLSDVVTDYDKTYEYVLSELERMQKEEDWLEYFDDYKDSVNRMFYGTEANEEDTDAYETYSLEPTIQWTMEEDHIEITFNRYDIASYAMGVIGVNIPYSSGLLSDTYFKAE